MERGNPVAGAGPFPCVTLPPTMTPTPKGADVTATSDDAWERLRAGDPAGLTAVYEDHVDAVHRFAFRRTASLASAEDVVQATFASVWRLAQRGRLPALELPTPRPFLLRVAGNECRNLGRSLRRRAALQERLHLREVTHDHADAVSARVDDERRMAQVRRALAGLPASQREAIELVHWEGLTVTQAAHTLGVAEGTIKSRLSRARRRLGEVVAEADEETTR